MLSEKNKNEKNMFLSLESAHSLENSEEMHRLFEVEGFYYRIYDCQVFETAYLEMGQFEFLRILVQDFERLQ